MFKNLPLWIFSPDTGLREKLRLAVLGEFEGIDIDIKEAAALSEKYSTSYVRGMLDSFNHKAGAWELPFALDSEEGTYQAGLQELEKYCLIASEIGARTVKTVLKSMNFKERLNTVAGILNDCECRIAVEFPLSHKKESLFPLKGNVGAISNSFTWHLSGHSPEMLKEISGSSFYVEICDTNKNAGQTTDNCIYLPGETGVINLVGFLTALFESGYKGPVSPKLPDRNILAFPHEMAVRLLGGSFARVWKKVFKEKEG